jgi:hypothetical protein
MTSAGIMPRIAWLCVAVLVGACSFDAKYTGGHFKCSDGVCPSGLTCIAGMCGTAGSADAMIDARMTAHTCADPEPVPVTGGTFSGVTTGRSNTVTASCAGSVMNGPDAVFRLDATIGDPITVAITGSYPVSAYAIAPCTVAPGTPACIGNAAATAGNPLAFTAAFTGAHYLVVDGVNPALSGDYTLTVTR